ncbi:MAG TPA: TIGR03435 family protein [Bryobacteraceae bacterium]|jgi:uncharacterized protein (TIGR03435 family)
MDARINAALRVAAFFLLPLPSFAQQFEVASIKPSAQDAQTQTRAHIDSDPSMVRYSGLSLALYLQMAYRLKNYQIVAPEWMKSTRWDITAKLPAGATAAQVPEMMQALLLERFQMKTHRETRPLPVYALLTDKGGLRMKKSPAEQIDGATQSKSQSVNAAMGGASTTVTYGNGASFTFGDNRLEGRHLPLATIADALSRFADKPVIDKTGVPGNFDFSMEFSPEDFRAMMIRAAIASGNTPPADVLKLLDASSGDTLAAAVEKLGLSLDSRQAPIEVLVIDQALQTPIAN